MSRKDTLLNHKQVINRKIGELEARLEKVKNGKIQDDIDYLKKSIVSLRKISNKKTIALLNMGYSFFNDGVKSLTNEEIEAWADNMRAFF